MKNIELMINIICVLIPVVVLGLWPEYLGIAIIAEIAFYLFAKRMVLLKSDSDRDRKAAPSVREIIIILFALVVLAMFTHLLEII